MKLPRNFFKPLATGAPAPLREVPVKLERMIHFVPPHIEKLRAKVPELIAEVDVVLGNLEDAIPADAKQAARAGYIAMAKANDFGATGLWTRVNPLNSPWLLDDVSALTRVHRPVAPKSLAFAIAMKPARAACLASAGIASSRLPSTTSTSAISSGTLARSFSMCGGTKWIMRSSFTGTSRSGAGAPVASGLKKLRGSFICLMPRLKRGVLDYGMKERPGPAKRFYKQARKWMSANAAARLLERGGKLVVCAGLPL